MKTLVMFLGAALLAAVSVVVTGGYVRALADGPSDVKSMENVENIVENPGPGAKIPDVFEDYAAPGLPATTCKGNPTGSDTNEYVFGYTRPDGFCAINAVQANSYNEAWLCARAYCSTCQLEDITGRYTESPFKNAAGLTSQYCPAK